MSKHDSRILNLSRNCRLKLHQAEERIKAGVMVWVDKGITVRELSLKEVIELREESRIYGSDSRGIHGPEIPGLKYQPPITDRGKVRQWNAIIRETQAFMHEFA